jgi:PAS domain-containing protein
MQIVTMGLLVLGSVALLDAQQGTDGFESRVKPLLRQNCVSCHSAKVRAGGLDLEAALGQTAAVALRERERWERVAARVRSGEMPPKGAAQPKRADAEAMSQWIDQEYARMDRTAPQDPGRVTVRRLNRMEYSNSVRDLLGVDLRPGDEFPVDAYGYGFDNIGDVLSLSPVLAERYLRAAGKVSQVAIPTDAETMKPTMHRYLAERMDQDRKLYLRVEHVFPVEGTYTLRSAWYQALRGGTRVRLRLFLDGREVAAKVLTFYYEMDRGLDSPQITVPPGKHLVEARIEVLADPAYKGSPPFLEYIQVYGPLAMTPAASSAAYKRHVSCGEGVGCMREVLETLANRAFRRPVRREEVNGLVTVAQAAQKRTGSFEKGLRAGLQAILVSPHFLFRIEQDVTAGPRRLNDHELATRLSYFLWASLPDARLRELADAGKLRDSAVVAAEVRRMLADPKSRALVESFGGQWLQTRNLSVLQPDRAKFPEYDLELREAMREETERFFAAVIAEDRSVLDLLDGRFTYLNERLARHYGIAGVEGEQFRRVELDGEQRSGVLTQASVLTVSSYPTRTSPVIRGKWLLETILNAPPPPPPPDVPPLDEQAVGSTGSLRQQLEKHRTNAVCASCHARMDPLGFGLENYDAVGKWRTMDGKFAVDASGELPGGKRFATPAELKGILKADEEVFTRGVTEKMLTYALGRGLEVSDRAAVREIVERVRKNGYRMSEMILGITESVPFRLRRAAAGVESRP